MCIYTVVIFVALFASTGNVAQWKKGCKHTPTEETQRYLTLIQSRKEIPIGYSNNTPPSQIDSNAPETLVTPDVEKRRIQYRARYSVVRTLPKNMKDTIATLVFAKQTYFTKSFRQSCSGSASLTGSYQMSWRWVCPRSTHVWLRQPRD